MAALGARCCFVAVVILIPLRNYIVLLARPMPPVYGSYTDFRLYDSDGAMLLMFVLWLASFVLMPRRITLGPRHVWIPLIGLLFAAGASTAGSYDPPLSLYHFARLLALFGLYVFVVNELLSPGWILFPVSIQLTSQAVVGLAQFIAQHSVGLGRLGETFLDVSAPGGSVVVAGNLRLMRAYGLTDHPSILGGSLAFGLIILLRACFDRTRSGAALAIFIPATMALVATFSRAAWLGLLCGAAVILSVEVRRRRWEAVRSAIPLGFASTIVVAAFLLAYPQFFGVRLNAGNSFSNSSTEQQSIGERVILIKVAVPMLLDHVATGVGIGASPVAMRMYYPDFSLAYQPPHWALFDVALETGLLGGVSYLALLIFPLLVFIRSRGMESMDPLAATAVALLLCIGVVGLFDYYTWLLNPGRIWQWLGWGLWAWALGRPRAQPVG